MNGRTALLVLIVLVLFPAFAHGQQSKLDSLETSLARHLKNDSTKVKILTDLCEAYRVRDTKKARKYGERALKLADALPWQIGIAGAYLQLGRE